MKKYLSFFILLSGLISLIGCSSGTNEEIPETPNQIIINENILTDGLSFTHVGGEKSVSFKTSQDWKLSVNNNANWCIPSKSEGSAGYITISFKINKNEKSEKRQTTITIQAGTANKTFSVTQDGLSQIIIADDLINNGIIFSFEGGEKSIDFKTNTDWELTLINDDSWCVPSQTSGTAGSASVSFKINKNEKTEKRETTITIKAGTANKTFTIIQDEFIPEIIIDNNLTENGIYVTNQKHSPRISFSVNTNWRIKTGNQKWCIPSSFSGGAGDHEITFSIDANETYYDRKTNIVIEAAGLKEVLFITQERKYTILTTTEHYTKKYTTGNILVNFFCNTDFDINIDSQWLKQISLESDKPFNHNLLVEAEENKDEKSRSATITITNNEKNLKKVITITQKGNPKDEGISPDGNIDNMEWE